MIFIINDESRILALPGVLIALSRLTVLLLAMVFVNGAAAEEFVAGEVVVGFKPAAQPQQIATMEAQLGLVLKADFPHIRARHYRLPAPMSVEQALPLIQQFEFVQYAEPNFLQKRQAAPTDPRFGEQWYLANTGQIVNGLQGTTGEDINWQPARNLFTGTREILVAVVDTGLALEHPDFSGRLWNSPVEFPPGANAIDDDGNGLVDDRVGWDFYDGDALPRDENGHGSLVASLIGAQADNGQGGAGVSPTARLLALRAGNDFGSIPISSTISAFTYAARRGAKIINFSAGGASFSNSLLATIQWLSTKGVLLVAAAGNGGSDGRGDDNDVVPTYPAAYPVSNIIAVAALDQNGNLAGFSNYGSSGVHIAAPGTNIFGAAIRTSTHYFENFETGAPGWTQAQLSGSQSSLSWGLYSDGAGNHWFGDSLSGNADINYQANTNSALISPAISLVGVTGAQMSANLWYRLGPGSDFGYVEVSEDNGATWNFLGSNTGFSFGACPGCSGSSGTTVRYDLSRYEGKTIRVRFRLQSDSSLNYSGLFVDDVKITRVEPFQYDGTQYQFLSGTSFSAPLVAGAAAMIWSQRPDLAPGQVRQIILSSARADARLSGKVSSGGRLDVFSALQMAIATPPGLTLSADFVDFTKQTVGSLSAQQAITLRNDSAGNITGFSFNISYSSGVNAFPMSNNCSTLVPGASCTVTLEFSPQQTGEIEGTIQVASSASGSPQVLSLLGVGTSTASSAVYAAAAYLPFPDNATWSYLKDGQPYTSTVLPGTTVFNGLTVRQVQDSDDGTISYYSTNAGGIFEHGYFSPPMFIDGLGVSSETLVLSPPSKIADAQGSLGQSFSSSGSAAITYSALPSTFVISYDAMNAAAAFETVVLPLGTFRALRVDRMLHIYGPIGSTGYVDSLGQGSSWVVEGLGNIKTVMAINSNGTVSNMNEYLTASSLLDASPDPFEISAIGNVVPGTQVISAPVTLQGFNAGVTIGVADGEYSIDGGPWTNANGMAFNGQSVAVRRAASANYGTTVSAMLLVGGVNAVFSVTTAAQGAYSVTVLRVGNGTVASSPPGISCGANCSATYAQGTIVTLTATPASNQLFSGWTGACTGTGTCTLTMDAAKDVSASFVPMLDTQAPTVPQALVASAVGAGQINLRWNTSSDNVGVTQYRLYRGGVEVAILGAGAARAVDTGLAALTTYTYAVSACDAAGNCSAPSATASATTLAAGQFAFTPQFDAGWNLSGNALNMAIDVAASFGSPSAPVSGITENIASVWKWNAVDGRWAFYTPLLSSAALVSYAAGQSYEVLTVINAGEGYWVNAINAVALPLQSGTGLTWNGFTFSALPSSWNLIVTADNVQPGAFNNNVSVGPPSPGVIPTENFVSLWAWDAPSAKWYFYAPSLASQPGLTFPCDPLLCYIQSHGYLDFRGDIETGYPSTNLGVGVGFWVNRP